MSLALAGGREVRLAFTLLVLSTALAGQARAHNRPPLCTSLVENQARSADLVIGTSFGLLMSADGGQRFRWVCEEAVGSAYGIDIHLVPLGPRLAAGTTFGVFTSDDRGCSWSEAPGTGGRAVSDLTGISGDPQRLYAVTQSSSMTNAVLVSTDGGQSFSSLLERDPPLIFNSVRVAPGRRQRLYAGAYANEQGLVLVSDDEGLSWEERPTGVALPTAVLGGGADDPDTVYLRVLGFTTSLARDQLLRSRNGGQSYDLLLELADSITGFQALSDGSLWVSTANAGVHFSDDDGASFQPLTGAPHATCLGVYQDRVYLCGEEIVDQASLFEVDAERTGVVPVFSFRDLCGPIECPADSPASTTCLPFYPAVSTQIGVDPQACMPGADGGPGDAGVGDGGGGPVDGGGSSTDASGDGPGDGGAPPSGGCAQLPRAGTVPPATAALLALLLLLARAAAGGRRVRWPARAAAAPPAREPPSRPAPR